MKNPKILEEIRREGANFQGKSPGKSRRIGRIGGSPRPGVVGYLASAPRVGHRRSKRRLST